MPIPAYPRGRPASVELRSLLDSLFVAAGIDIQRSIEPPMSSIELGSAGNRPTDETLMNRFILHARRSVRYMRDPLLLVLAWKPGVDCRLQDTISSLALQLPKVETGALSRHVLVLEDAMSAFDFETHAERNGSIIGKVHSGGIWWTEFGRFLLVSWQPLIPLSNLSAELKGFVSAMSQEPDIQYNRETALPPADSGVVPVSDRIRQAARRPSTSRLNAVPERLKEPASRLPAKRRP